MRVNPVSIMNFRPAKVMQGYTNFYPFQSRGDDKFEKIKYNQER